MSLDLTFRQKLIRIGCSAAICGLSLSFIVGEAVDREAKLLRSWETDPSLLPYSYLPVYPMAKAIQQWDSPIWREQLIATNSLKTVPEIGNSNWDIPGQIASTEPSLRINRKTPKAPILASRPTGPLVESYVQVSAAPESSRGTPVNRSDMEVILASIHSATAKLSQQGLRRLPTEASPEVSKSHVPKHTSNDGAPLPTNSSGPGVVAARRPTPTSELATIEAPWILNGRVLASTAQSPEPGHYEIGLFSKIDPDGRPVGFPLPQQILPTGQTSFRMEVPAPIVKGYLFAEFVSAKTGKRTLVMPPVNPWTRDMRQTAELYFRLEDRVTSVVASSLSKAATQEQLRVRGTVTTMFSGATKVPQADVIVKLRGRKESTRTDTNGLFSLSLPKVKGTMFLEVLKAGYHPVIVSVNADSSEHLQIEIASRHAIEQLSQRLGSNQSDTKGIFIGKTSATDGSGLRGMTAQLSLKADGPFYFDEEGVVTRDLRQTSGNGRFIFLNVESGTGYLEASLNGDPITPLQVSTVDGGEMIMKSLSPVSGIFHGRVFNPVAEAGKMGQIGGARVRIDGASEWVTTDSFGAFSMGPLKWFKGEKITLELTAEKFNNHRYQLNPDSLGSATNLFAFPAHYISRLARSMDVDMDPYAGVIIGKFSGSAVRIDALADHSTVNSARDFYFDSRGKLRGSHEMTDPRFGTFIIFNVPKGRTLVHGNDSAGQLRYSDGIVSGAASINVLME